MLMAGRNCVPLVDQGGYWTSHSKQNTLSAEGPGTADSQVSTTRGGIGRWPASDVAPSAQQRGGGSRRGRAEHVKWTLPYWIRRYLLIDICVCLWRKIAEEIFIQLKRGSHDCIKGALWSGEQVTQQGITLRRSTGDLNVPQRYLLLTWKKTCYGHLELVFRIKILESALNPLCR